MPRVSFAKEDMFTPSLRGFVERVGSRRLGEVVDAKVKYHQWQPSKATGTQTEPLTAAFLSIVEVDPKTGDRIGEPVDQELVIEWGPKDGSVIRVRPGIADDREDAEPDDTLNENGDLVLGTEGNTLYADEGTKLNITNPWGVFAVSCQEKGFKPQILACGYLPDFVGMRAWFDLRPGREYTNKAGAQVKTEDFIVQEIVRFPYEQKAPGGDGKHPTTGPKPKAVGQSAPKPVPVPVQAQTAQAAPRANGAPQAQAQAAPAPQTPAGDGAATEADRRAFEALKEVCAEYAAGQYGDQPVARQKLIALGLQKALDPKRKDRPDRSIHRAIQDRLKDEAWFLEHSVEFGAVNVGVDEYTLIGT